MRIRFWGTRGSIAKAGSSTLRYGGNTSCVELRSAAGTLVVLDCGTGAHGLGIALSAEGKAGRVGHILITHTHWDHIQGLPFFAPLFIPGNEWHIYGPRGLGPSMRETIAGQMQYTYFPVTPEQFAAKVDYHDLVEGVFKVGDITVTTEYLNHPGLTLGYRLEADGASVVYVTDHEPHASELAGTSSGERHVEDERHLRFLADADLLIHDAQYLAEEYPQKKGWGHSTVEYVVDTAIAARVRRLSLFHHDPSRDDDAVDRLLVMARDRAARSGWPFEISAAAEGQVVDLIGSSKQVQPEKPDDQASALSVPPRPLGDSAVLLIASDESSAQVLSDAAHADGLQVLEAHDCEETIATANSKRPSLLITERYVGQTDAIEACQAIRETTDTYGKSVPIVVVADSPDEVDIHKGTAAGVTDWLVKPFSTVYARTRIRAWLLRLACRWEKAPLPEDEVRRIGALHELEILDTPPEQRFDRYTRIAATLFDVPIALVSLVDTDRQWFKSAHGLDAEETPRDMAFCAHAILTDDILLVPDALQDPRFADNPLVTENPRVRFYAGVPLKAADGSRIGTLCVIDHRPRYMDDSRLTLLRDLGGLVERELQTKI